MLHLIVTLNLLLAVFCLYVAGRIWQFRRALAQATEALTIAERNTHNVLCGAPEAIIRGQIGTRQLRQSYQQLQPQLARAKQAFALVSFSQSVWQRRRLTQSMMRQWRQKLR
jgi:monoamine oxidase